MSFLRLHAVLAALAVASTALAAAAPAIASPGDCTHADERATETSERLLAKSTVCLLNRERSSRGMRALSVNRRLSRIARSHTRDMVANRYFAHVSQGGRDVIDRVRSTGYLRRARSWLVGENLAWGTGSRSSPRETVEAWMESPGHRRNILMRRFREIGVGIAFEAPASSAGEAATYTTTFGYRR